MSDASPYRLVRTPLAAVVAPVLDPSQQAVVDHAGGPLLVLAGPGTGKTTTLVEAVVERVRRGASPEAVLVLTFSRKAADELRERIAGRLARTVSSPSAWTFHAWCLALVRAYDEGALPRLLSGPERLVRIRDLLAGSAAGEGATRWPDALTPALPTQGMAREVADLLDRARERGLQPVDVAEAGQRVGRPDWVAAATFYDEYVEVLGARGEMDYAELVRRALLLLADPVVLAEVRARYTAVFVDEYQDTDPAQEQLLRQLAGGGGDLVVVGDPDQSIYAFRGADVSCILEFPDRFRTTTGLEAPTLTLGVSRRAGGELLAVSRAVAQRLPAPGLAADRLRAHRALEPVTPGGSAEVRVYSTVSDEATAVADTLRRAHLDEGLPWSSMAVLVRSGVRTIPVLRRSLVAAGVPVAVASDEVPVARDPAVAPLLLALRFAGWPERLTEDEARELLLSPLVRATPADLRRLGRFLRQQERDTLDGREEISPGRLQLPRASATLIREAVLRHVPVEGLDDRVARRVARVHTLLDDARAVLVFAGASGEEPVAGAEQALWAVWDASRLGSLWARTSAAGGQQGRAADRDLDAVVALFDAVARFEERRPRAGVAELLAELQEQEIPSQSRSEGVLAGQGAVRLLTAHRSKGLEWDLVVVASVQDGGWPDLRRRASLLDGDRLDRSDPRPAPTASSLIVDERRLFYVAVTRARRRLVVTAVRSPLDDGDRPSRFLGELGLDVPDNARPTQLLSLASLTGRLRRALVDEASSESLRHAAAASLARLAATGPNGLPLVRAAHPDHWWGMREASPGARPVRPADEPVRLSASAIASYHECPLRWFLDREAQAVKASTASAGFGLVVHALANMVATGALPAQLPALLARLDEVWGSLGFDARWERDGERRQAIRALERFLAWHESEGRHRELVASEWQFEVPYDDAVLRGSFDRVELDADQRAVVVDFKTGKSKPSGDNVATHPQLGAYQVAIRAGALRDKLGDDVALGGAELVHLRLAALVKDGGDSMPALQKQGPLDDPEAEERGETVGWAEALVTTAAAGIRTEQFVARVSSRCDHCDFARACPAQDAGSSVVS
ncbi:ATP-dependent DNA helicase [Acidothermaceae bacterium B102]|nr:ATP-dependent DNA helicase [Acidothermaceae bacterium B102]